MKIDKKVKLLEQLKTVTDFRKDKHKIIAFYTTPKSIPIIADNSSLILKSSSTS
jgi:hypothetical protein